MISPLPSLTFTAPRTIPGKPYTGNENPALSPKRSFAQHEEDRLSQLELKRRRDAQPSRRVPLDPLSASDLENRRNSTSQSTDSASYHSFVTPVSLPDLRVLHPEQPSNSGSCGWRRSSTSDAPLYSWPPQISTLGTGGPSHGSPAGKQVSLHSSGENKSTRGDFLESTSTWHPQDPTTIMTTPIQTAENVLQPVRPRTASMPSVRRPPEELWRSDPGPTKAAHETVDGAKPLVCPTPPGLPPRRPELRHSSSVSELLPHGSVSLSLALGSQPLRASEHTKAVSPIGAERSRVVSIASFKSHTRNPPMAGTNDKSLWCSSQHSPRLDAEWKKEACLVNTTLLDKAQTEVGHATMSKEALERLLRQAARNKYSPKITSPLSPLHTAAPAFDLSADLGCQLRMPSELNNPSHRYSKCLPRRARTVCDGYQSFNWDTTCMHCQECKRDTLRKRLLAFRYRQHHVQRNRFHAYPARGTNTSVVDDDRLVLANRLREVFAYDMDEEEKSLWEEVAAVTGAGPLSFSRAGSSCAATHRQAVDDGHDDGTRDDHVEISDEGLLATESAILFRDVSVY